MGIGRVDGDEGRGSYCFVGGGVASGGFLHAPSKIPGDVPPGDVSDGRVERGGRDTHTRLLCMYSTRIG